MAYCYILFSKKLNKYYTGITSETIEQRLAKHTEQYYDKSHFTYAANDWKLVVSIPCSDMGLARKIEIYRKFKEVP